MEWVEKVSTTSLKWLAKFKLFNLGKKLVKGYRLSLVFKKSCKKKARKKSCVKRMFDCFISL